MALGFIISPAKKMNVVEGPPYAQGMPQHLAHTKELLCALRALSYDEAKELWRCSDRLAEENYARLQDMRLEDARTAAVIAYEGIQYQHLAAQVMNEDELCYLGKHLRILSGFYGVLRPFDAVVPYRLEMQARLSMPAYDGHPATRNLYEWWGDTLSHTLAGEFDTVVNIASVEYAKAVTTQLPALGTRIVTCLFGTLRPSDGKLLQRSTEAKAARGTFMRWCAEHNAVNPADLRTFNERHYRFHEPQSTENTLVFIRE